VFVRFAGPRLSTSIGEDAEAPPDLIPYALRPGDRAFGGALTWARAARLAPFESGSPFFGLEVPDDVTVSRQVLTQPSIAVEANTWARLADGTPLVTARAVGDGWLVLVHVTANAAWSTLPLSGLFVEMLERLVAMSAGVDAPPAGADLTPQRTLDGRGAVGPPPASALPLAAADVDAWTPAPRHPPGLYAAKGYARALNLTANPAAYARLDPAISGLETRTYGADAERDLRGLALGAAALLFLIDLLATLAFRGLLPGVRASAAGLLLAFAGAAAAPPAAAQTPSIADDLAAGLSPRIAYVRTGDAQVDALVEAGMRGLSTVVRRRTAAELGEPVAVDVERDELALYPLIYWPLTDGQSPPGAFGAEAVRRFLATGGMILFDTRNGGGGGAGSATLRAFAAALDLPPTTGSPRW
jgi:hypothetical protein